MELIYLYLGNIKRPLKNQELHFGSKFRASYDPETRELTIEDQPNAKPCIYGNRIKSLDLLVGQNGTGKSTILDLLGLPIQSRNKFLPYSELDNVYTADSEWHTWFALYHIENNLFSIEGYGAYMIKFLVENDTVWHPFYSALFHYDVRTQLATNVQDLCFTYDNRHNHRLLSSKLFYVLYEPKESLSWYNRPYTAPKSNITSDSTFQRIFAGQCGYEGISRYLYDSVHNHEFASKMASRPGTEITIEIHQKDMAGFTKFSRESVDDDSKRPDVGRIIAGRLLYNGQAISLVKPSQSTLQYFRDNLHNPFTDRERMVLIYLEELACTLILQGEFKPTTYQGDNTYLQRKQYLLDALRGGNQTDYRLARKIVAGIEAIPNRYFKNGIKAIIPLHEMPDENFLTTLATGLDECLCNDHEINHLDFIHMSFTGISTGEAQFLDLYASLYHAIKNSGHLQGDTCVLLLDEPDCRFHPEWSRNFILNLTELLNTDAFRNYNYQVIISTHSPFLVSDVPKESIHCLRRDNDGSISIQASPYGLLSNLNDLITDSFFAESIFGAFAEQYANTLIEDIRAIEQQRNSVTRNQLTELHDRLDRIEDSMVRESLNRRLYRLEARAR